MDARRLGLRCLELAVTALALGVAELVLDALAVSLKHLARKVSP